jgi:TolB-like protein
MTALARLRALSSAAVTAVLLLLACGSATAAMAEPQPQPPVSEPLPVLTSRSPVGAFNAMIIFMADQLERNLDRRQPGSSYVVATFTNLDRLQETTSFGRLLAENLAHELQVRKWQMFDVRLTKDLIVSDAGEFILSRDIRKIRDTYKLNGVVTGTYAAHDASVIVNARVIDLDSGIVIGSAQAHFPRNCFTESLLATTESRSVIKIIGDK